jgi:hypothetical protein
MIVEIEDDNADAIVVASMAQIYVSLSESLKKPKKWDEDDIAKWKELLPAIKLVGEWFSVDFEKEIKKAKKK